MRKLVNILFEKQNGDKSKNREGFMNEEKNVNENEKSQNLKQDKKTKSPNIKKQIKKAEKRKDESGSISHAGKIRSDEERYQ
jgi:hypothetical protein